MSERDEIPTGIAKQIDSMEQEIADMEQEIASLRKENAELGADKIYLIQAEMDGGDRYHYTAHDIGYRYLEKKCKALEADYLVSNRELLILQAEIVRLRKERRWIPVSERLPEAKADTLYLCYVDGINKKFVDARTWFASAQMFNLDVTHWMPLPTPPEDE